MDKLSKKIFIATFSIMLFFVQNSAWATVDIKPMFDCAKAKTPAEKLVCKKNSTLYYYDAILNTVYLSLKSTLPPQEFNTLKQQQLQWLKQTRSSSRSEDVGLDGVVYSKAGAEIYHYANRISYLSIHYKNYLQPFYLNALAQGKMSSNLLYAFMWFFYTDYDMSGTYSTTLANIKKSYTFSNVCGTHGCSPPWLDVDSKFYILKLSPTQYIVAGQMNNLGDLDILDNDGGVYSFYLVQPAENLITSLKVQDPDENTPTFETTLSAQKITAFNQAKKQITFDSSEGVYYFNINLQKMRLESFTPE